MTSFLDDIICTRHTEVENIITHPTLSGNAVNVYLYASFHAPNHYLTAREVCRDKNITEGEVHSAVKELESLGYVGPKTPKCSTIELQNTPSKDSGEADACRFKRPTNIIWDWSSGRLSGRYPFRITDGLPHTGVSYGLGLVYKSAVSAHKRHGRSNRRPDTQQRDQRTRPNHYPCSIQDTGRLQRTRHSRSGRTVIEFEIPGKPVAKKRPKFASILSSSNRQNEDIADMAGK